MRLNLNINYSISIRAKLLFLSVKSIVTDTQVNNNDVQGNR